MKKIISSIAAFALTVLGMGALATSVVTTPVYADSVSTGAADQFLDEAGGSSGLTQEGLSGVIGTIINFVLGIVGMICVVIIIVGGITYATSQGDAGKVSKATKTLLYGVVGLVVCLLAFAIVNFVLDGIGGTAA